MPRRNNRQRTEPRPIGVGAGRETVRGLRGEEWTVQRVRGNERAYRCPGCEQEIAPGTSHLVAWREDSISGVDARRHWHTPCWSKFPNRR